MRKIKLDGATSEHKATLIETGPQGCWLYSPAGTVVTRSDGTTTTQPADGVQFFPAARWFTAWCWARAQNPPKPYWDRRWILVDVAKPAEVDLDAGLVSFVNLELDLWCTDEDVGVVDQDELDDAERRGLLTSVQAVTARRTAEELYNELRTGCAAAFDGVGWRLLEQARPQRQRT